MRKGKKVARKEKPKHEKWVVVNAAGQLKYPPAFGSEAQGYDKPKALRLAEPGHPSHEWYAVPIGYWRGDHTSLEGVSTVE